MYKFVLLSTAVAIVVLGPVKGFDTPPNPGSDFHNPQNVHNKEHLRKHMNEIYEDQDLDEQVKMDTDEEMEFHYFKLHDYDNNNKLDGLELGAAMTHFHHDEATGDGDNPPPKPLPIGDQELATLVQQILKDDDLNDDGYVDYYEFVRSQKEKDML